MTEHGLEITAGQGMTRVQMSCMHQSGLLYVVPGEKSWVCSREHMPAHALAGFMAGLMDLDDSRIRDLMQQWGIYYRSLPLNEETEQAGRA